MAAELEARQPEEVEFGVGGGDAAAAGRPLRRPGTERGPPTPDGAEPLPAARTGGSELGGQTRGVLVVARIQDLTDRALGPTAGSVKLEPVHQSRHVRTSAATAGWSDPALDPLGPDQLHEAVRRGCGPCGHLVGIGTPAPHISRRVGRTSLPASNGNRGLDERIPAEDLAYKEGSSWGARLLEHPAWTAIGALATVLFGVVEIVVAQPAWRSAGSMLAAPTSSGRPAHRRDRTDGPGEQADRRWGSRARRRHRLRHRPRTGDIVPRLGPGEIPIRIDNQPHPTELVDAEANDTGLRGFQRRGLRAVDIGVHHPRRMSSCAAANTSHPCPCQSSIGLPSSGA